MSERFDMNDELASLENELRALSPAVLDPSFEQMLGESVSRPRRGSWLWGAGSAVAAACLVAMFSGPVDDPVSPGPRLEERQPGIQGTSVSTRPVRSASSWERTFDDGPVLLDRRVPARQVTHQKLRTVRWRDPVRNVVIEIVIPEEQVKYLDLEVN